MSHKSSGFAVIGVAIIAVLLITVVIVTGGSFLRVGSSSQILKNRQDNGLEMQQDKAKEVIYKEDGVEVAFLWPSAHEFISNEESEIQISNLRANRVEITNPSLSILSSESFSPASEGFTSFTSKTSNKEVDKIVIYNSQPESSLILEANQFGKLHYHFLFNDKHAQSSTQNAQISLNLIINGKTTNITKNLARIVKPESYFQSSAIHPVEEQIRSDQPSHQ